MLRDDHALGSHVCAKSVQWAMTPKVAFTILSFLIIITAAIINFIDVIITHVQLMY